MFDKLSTVETRYDELMTRLGTVEVQSDAAEYKKAAKALAELEPLVQKYREYKTVEYKVYSGECYYVRTRANLRQMYLDMVDFFDRYLR